MFAYSSSLSSVHAVKTVCFLILFLACGLLCCLQSLPTLFKYLNVDGSGETTIRKSATYEQLNLPAIVFCNRLPYSQASLNSLGKSFNQDTIRQYLQEWFDPSTVDSPDYENMPEDGRKSAEVAVAQFLPNAGLKQRLDQVVLKCQDFVSSCVINGEMLSGFDCCQNVEPFLATLNGICWIFRNQSFVQNFIDYRFGIQITIQIVRNSFFSSSQTTHPGLFVFLASSKAADRIRLVTELASPRMLKDKHSLRLLVRKQVETNLRRHECGSSLEAAERYDLFAFPPAPNSNNLTFATCLIEAAIQQCACVPLSVVIWTLQGDLNISFLRRFDVSSICTVKEYNRCARRYINNIQPERAMNFQSTVNRQLKNTVDYCKSTSRTPCQRTTYEIVESEESELPQEYRSTQDFISRISIAYDSLLTTQIIQSKSVDLCQLLMIVGYNFATWFAVGHLIWTIVSWCCSCLTAHPSHKVGPRQSMMITSPIRIRPRHQPQQHLPPLEINPTSSLSETKTLHNNNGHTSRTREENVKEN